LDTDRAVLIAVKRRIRPITDFGDEPMLDRVVMNIIHMPGKHRGSDAPKSAVATGQAPAAYAGMPIDLPTADVGPSGRRGV